MPRLRLIMDPLVSDKNTKLQRKCEKFCRILDKDLKSSKQKLNKEAENCVQSLYTLMLEAEEHENSRNDANKPNAKQQTEMTSTQEHVQDEKRRSSGVRPITATGYGKRPPDVAIQNRPYSASPRIVRNEMADGETQRSRRKSSFIPEEPQFNQIIPAWEKDTPGSLYKDRRLYWNMPIYTDQKDTETKRTNKLNQPESPRQIRESSSVKPSRYVTKHSSPMNSHDNFSDVESCISENELGNVKLKPRPKTAADYRRKQPEDEMSQYWSKRINRLINKWDIEDKPNNNQGLHLKCEFDVAEDSGPKSPIAPPESAPVGEATRRKNQFMQTYGKRYMFAIRADPAAQAAQNKYKRPVIVTRQELASIHADLAKKRKQTRLILRKSKRIVTSMAKIASVMQ